MHRTGHYLFTSESVTEGHPDKIADQVSDGVLDAILAQDPTGRVACESLLTTNLIVLAGEITTSAEVDYEAVARDAVRDVGYTDAAFGFDADSCEVQVRLHSQSPDIAMGVDPGGAGDQGLMFGYACMETPERMPLPIALAHRLVRALSKARRDGVLEYLRPDGKSQVTVEYNGDEPQRIHTVVVSSQHSDKVSTEQLRTEIEEAVVRSTLPADLLDDRTIVHVNPTGRFVTGRTARRLRPDWAEDHSRHLRRHGSPRRRRVLGKGSDEGGPFGCVHGALHREELCCGGPRRPCAGAAGVCDRRSRPGLGTCSRRSTPAQTGITDEQLGDLVRAHFALKPREIMETLDLRRPIYRSAAAFGHFGRSEPDFTWERTDKADALRAAAGAPEREAAAVHS